MGKDVNGSQINKFNPASDEGRARMNALPGRIVPRSGAASHLYEKADPPVAEMWLDAQKYRQENGHIRKALKVILAKLHATLCSGGRPTDRGKLSFHDMYANEGKGKMLRAIPVTAEDVARATALRTALLKAMKRKSKLPHVTKNWFMAKDLKAGGGGGAGMGSAKPQYVGRFVGSEDEESESE